MQTFQAADAIAATRCPRQFVLRREGQDVVPAGALRVAVAAQEIVGVLATGAPGDRRLLASLAERDSRPESVGEACYRIAYRETHRKAMHLAASVDGSDLARLDGIVRSLSGHFASLLLRARQDAPNAAQAIAQMIVGFNEPMAIEAEDVRIEWKAGLLSQDTSTGMTWVWDLGTPAGSLAAQAIQVQLWALAYDKKGIEVTAALSHLDGARLELVRASAVTEIEREGLSNLLRGMLAWAAGRTPPAASERGTCRACPAQAVCWSRWGRTLAEADEYVEEVTVATPSVRAERPSIPSVKPNAAPLEPPPLWWGEDPAANAPARLKVADLANHVAVFGAAGAGKTCLTRVVAEEAALQGIAVLVLDTQGDLASLARKQDATDPNLSARTRALRDRVEFRIFTPASDAGLRTCLNPLRLMSSPMDGEARTSCLAAAADNLLGALRIPEAWEVAAKEYVAQVLGAVKTAVSLAELVELVRTPSSLQLDPILRSRTRREALAEQLRALGEGPLRFLYGTGQRLGIDDVIVPLEPGKTPVSVVWLGGVGDSSARNRYAATILADVLGWMMDHRATTPQLVVCMDDVAPFVPPHGEPPGKGILKRLLEDGQEHGVSAMLCARSLTEVDAKVLQHAGTIALGKLGSSQDRARARKLLSAAAYADATSAADQLMTVAAGMFLVTRTGAALPPRWLKARTPVTAHTKPWTEADIRAHTEPGMREAWRAKR